MKSRKLTENSPSNYTLIKILDQMPRKNLKRYQRRTRFYRTIKSARLTIATVSRGSKRDVAALGSEVLTTSFRCFSVAVPLSVTAVDVQVTVTTHFFLKKFF